MTKLCVLAAIALSASCSIQHRSGDFACTSSADCTGGRTCDSDGFCVTSGTGSGSGSNHPDAGIPDAMRDGRTVPDAEVCPSICTSCDISTKACEIDCATTDACTGGNGPVVCPAGFNCQIDCSTQNSCRNVTCAGAGSCTINCTGQNSCRGVTCGAGACDVECIDNNSCEKVTCGSACSCDVNCPGTNACQQGAVTCKAALCRNLQDGGCVTENNPQVCDTCRP